jgi:uncharacterized phiE125 gp8 family phage protein
MAWAPNYVTTAELRSYLNISDSADDTELDLAIAAASRAVDTDTNRQFGVVGSAEERFYTARWDRKRCRWVVDIDDLMSTSNFDAQIQDTDGVDVGQVNDYFLEPRNAAARARPWTQLVVKPDSTYKPTGLANEVAITALWGWTAVPDTVKQATRLQASRLFARRTSPYGIAGSPDVGSELRLLARVDPDVSVALRSYRRWWGAA